MPKKVKKTVKKSSVKKTATKKGTSAKKTAAKKETTRDLKPVMQKTATIPKEIVLLFDAFDFDNEKYNAGAIEEAAKKIRTAELNNLVKSIFWDSDEGKLLKKKISKKYIRIEDDFTRFAAGKYKSSDFDIVRCLCDKDLYREWLCCFMCVCYCYCCGFCNDWPIVHPVHPIYKYFCKCRLLRIRHSAGTFFAHTLDFKEDFSVNQSPIREANIDIVGGGSSTCWCDIDMTGSNISDIVARDHSTINDNEPEKHRQIDDTVSATNALWSSTKISSELSAKPDIDDGSTSGNSVWSSSKVNSELSARACIDDTCVAATSVWSSNAVAEKMKVIHGEYYGDPASPGDGSSPFKFNINNLSTTINASKVFVLPSGYKTNLFGKLLSPVQISWDVSFDGTDYIVELTVSDDSGVIYNPGAPEWLNKKVKLQFHAYYADDMPNATFIS